MNWRNACFAALFAIPLLVLLASGFGHDPHAVPSMLENKPAPAFALKALNGDTVALASLRGRPVVLNFWATWCYPCQAEHELLQRAAREFGDKVHFIGIIYQDDSERMRAHLQARANNYPQLEDPASVTAIDYGVGGVPETFILDAAGQVVHKQSGVLTADILYRTLDALLRPHPSPQAAP
jgi:cytochrome c biogenesis protein CcmG/thiol:disulfide interchange protein DsbE